MLPGLFVSFEDCKVAEPLRLLVCGGKSLSMLAETTVYTESRVLRMNTCLLLAAGAANPPANGYTSTGDRHGMKRLNNFGFPRFEDIPFTGVFRGTRLLLRLR